MLVRHWIWLGLLLAQSPVWAQVDDSSTTLETPELPQTTLSDETETKGIIPVDAADTLLSSRPVTPTSIFPQKKPYDQARDELIRAMDLWAKGRAEAASDTALEAYDDFIDIRRVPGVKRSVIREQAHQAAKVYVEAGIAYIKGYTERMGSTPEAVAEGRARMEDLRDVARNYPELNRMLNSAIQKLLK
jgi:hypothetical protein